MNHAERMMDKTSWMISLGDESGQLGTLLPTTATVDLFSCIAFRTELLFEGGM